MMAVSLCALLLLSCWQFNSWVAASFQDVGFPEGLLQREVSGFARRLDEVALTEHGRFSRALDGHPGSIVRRDSRRGNRVKREAPTDFRHGFHPGTGVGNREDFEITSVEPIADTLVANGSAWEWGHLATKDNATILFALTGEALLVYRLQLGNPGGPLSLMERYPDVDSFEAYDRFSWQKGHIVKTNHYLSLYDATRFLSHFQILNHNNLTLQNSIDLGPLSVVDLEYFAFDTVTFLGALTGNGFLRLYRWSSRYCRFFVGEDLTIPVAVSNMQAFDISGRHYLLVTASETSSVLFKYHQMQNSFRQYQLLYPGGAKKAFYFTDAYDHFLVFIDRMGLTSTFFRWNENDQFVSMQVLDTAGANHWHAVAVPGLHGGSLLVLSSDGSQPERQPLALYKHDPTTDAFQAIDDAAIISALNPPGYVNATSSLSFREGANVFLLVGVVKGPSAQEPGHLFRLTFDTLAVTNPVTVESQEVEAKIKHFENEVSRLNSSLVRAKATVLESVTKDGDETIRGEKIFSKVTINEVQVKHIVVEDAYIYPPMPTGNESLLYLVNKTRRQREEIEGLQVLMGDAVFLNCSQIITGGKDIQNVTVEGALTFSNFTTTYFDDVDIDELNKQAFRLDGLDQVINGDLTFTKNLESTKSIVLDDLFYVNSIDISEDAVLTYGVQSIGGKKVFEQATDILSDMALGSGVLLNEIDPSEQVVTLGGSHLITGQLTFAEPLHVKGNILTSSTIDGVDPGTVCVDVLTKEGTQTVSGPLVFTQAAVFKTDVKYGGLLMGVNLTQLSEKTVRINQDTNVTGSKDFLTDIDITGDVVVEGLVNSMDLSEDVVQLMADNGTISSARTLSGKVTVSGALTTDGEVNGLDLSEDVVTLSGDHSIEGKKNFTQGIHVPEIGKVSGTVDTVDLSAWAEDIMTLSTVQTVNGPIVFLNNITMQSNLTVSGLINGINLEAMYRDTYFKTSDQVQTISGSKNFSQPLTVTSGRLILNGLINGYNLTEDFLNKYSNQSITGQKTFSDGFAADAGLEVSGLIADLDLEALYDNSLIRGRQAHLRGHRTFLGNVTVDGIVDITGTVDGIDVSTNVLTTNGDQTVTGLKTFRNLTASSMSCTDMDDALTVNGRNWTEFVLGRVDLSTKQDISVNHTITASVTAANVDIEWMVNTVNLTALLNDIMSKSTAQTVTGSKTCRGTFVVHGNVSLDAHINDIRLSEFAGRAFLLDGAVQVITGKKTLSDLATLFEHLTLTGLLDGVDLDFFMSDIIFPENLPKITGTKTFPDGFSVNGNITVSTTVDSIDLSEDVMTTNTDQNISGSYIFGQIVTTDVDTTVSGFINGIDLVHLNNSILKTSGDQTVNSPLIFTQDLTSKTDISVTGFVDGTDLSELKSQTTVMSDPFNLNGTLTFDKGVTFEGPLNFTGFLNGRNLSAWYQSVVLLHTDEVVLGNKTFRSDVAVDDILSVPGDMEVNVVFGHNFDSFVADAVNLTGDTTITGRKTFSAPTDARSNVTVKSTIDGISIEDIVTLNGEDVISGLKTFNQNITVNGHINTTGLVNGVNISDIYAKTFRLDSPQVVAATKEFTQDVTATGDVVVGGLVDGIDLDLEAVTLDTSQTLSGAISFSVPVTVDGNMNVTGYIGGVNLTLLVTDRATLRGNETVYGRLTFGGPVTFRADVWPADLVDGVNLSDLWRLQTKMLDWAWLDIGLLDLMSSDQCLDVRELQRAYANTVENLAYILEIQDVGFRVRSFEAFMLDGVRHLALAVHSNKLSERCVDSYVYAWNASGYEFVRKDVIATNGAYRWHAFNGRGRQYLAIANEALSPCDGDSSVTNVIYAYNGNQLIEHQELPSDETYAMDTVVIRGVLHLALANAMTTASSSVYRQGKDGLFQLMQNFTIGGAMDVEFLHDKNITLLVFASDSPTQSPVYMYNSETEQFDFHQYVSTSYATAVDGFKHQGRMGVTFANHAKLFANNKISYDVPIEVYYWVEATSQFELFEVVEFIGAVDVVMFHIGADLYLAGVSEYEEMKIFRYEGVVGFSLEYSLASYGIVSMEVFDIPDLPAIRNLFFALAIDPYSEEDLSSRILREKVIGQNVNFEDMPCDVDIKNKFHGNRSLLKP